MKLINKEKTNAIIWTIIYSVLLIGIVVSSCFLFKSRYYTVIFVSGQSMNPTLIGNDSYGRVDYGLADTDRVTVSQIKRFDVVVTNFPHSWNISEGKWKIKRVWGLPNERISLTYSPVQYEGKSLVEFTYTVKDLTKMDSITGDFPEDAVYKYTSTVFYDEIQKTWEREVTFNITDKQEKMSTDFRSFNVRRTQLRKFEVDLGENDYFVMGDNWGGSSDSYSYKDSSDRVTLTLLQGLVIAIEGTAKVKKDTAGNPYLIDKKPYEKTKYHF